ncbi:hypothetical protein GGP93_002058 [Salinibacter ruber]|nr:hypothetical protein [Salinibacter ruber]
MPRFALIGTGLLRADTGPAGNAHSGVATPPLWTARRS